MRLEPALTSLVVSVNPPRMGRKKQWAQDMQARFPDGTFERIASVLVSGEDRTDFVREAVEREIARREVRSKAVRRTLSSPRKLPG